MNLGFSTLISMTFTGKFWARAEQFSHQIMGKDRCFGKKKILSCALVHISTHDDANKPITTLLGID